MSTRNSVALGFVIVVAAHIGSALGWRLNNNIELSNQLLLSAVGAALLGAVVCSVLWVRRPTRHVSRVSCRDWHGTSQSSGFGSGDGSF